MLRFFVAKGEKEMFTCCLYTCYDFIRPNIALELSWRFSLFDYSMPYFIQIVKELTTKVEVVQKKHEDREKKEEKQDENSKYTRKEFSYTSFSRTFTMPDHVNTESISAEYVNGVLTLVLPKREEAKKKPIKEIAVS